MGPDADGLKATTPQTSIFKHGVQRAAYASSSNICLGVGHPNIIVCKLERVLRNDGPMPVYGKIARELHADVPYLCQRRERIRSVKINETESYMRRRP